MFDSVYSCHGENTSNTVQTMFAHFSSRVHTDNAYRAWIISMRGEFFSVLYSHILLVKRAFEIPLLTFSSVFQFEQNCTSEHSPPAMPTASSSRSSQEPHARRQQNPTQLLHQQPQPSAKILANVNSNTPKSHNFNKNPQTIVSCKNNKFIVFEASSPADDEMQLNSLRKKLYE